MNPEKFATESVHREVLRFATANEFRARPAYQAELTCASDDLDRIVGKYAFAEKEQLQCGLNRCHRWHWHGYVIRTKDGRETHCGQDCGAREFQVSWDGVEAIFKQREDFQARRDLLCDFAPRRAAMLRDAEIALSIVESARDKLAAVLAEIKQAPELATALETALRDDGRIRLEIPVTQEQRDENPNARGRFETLATLDGFRAVHAGSRIATILRHDVVAPLQRLSDEVIASLDDAGLRREAKALDGRRAALAEANQFQLDAERFCRRENLGRFSHLRETLSKRHRNQRVDRVLDRVTKLFGEKS